MLEWAKSHDAEAQRIAQNAQSFAMRHLNRQSRLCYMFHLISELSKQMRWAAGRHSRRQEELAAGAADA